MFSGFRERETVTVSRERGAWYESGRTWHGKQIDILFCKFSGAGSHRDGGCFFYQSVCDSESGRMACGIKYCILFDNWKPWNTWGLPALWHFVVSKFVSISQNYAK